MITYRMMRDNFGGGYIQKIRVNHRKKTITMLEEYKNDNDIVNCFDVENVKKHLNKDYFDYCKGCLNFGQRRGYYYISTNGGLKLIKNGYVVNVGGVEFGFERVNNTYVVTDILTGCLINAFSNLWELYTNLQKLKNDRMKVNEKRLRELRKNFLENFKKVRKEAA